MLKFRIKNFSQTRIQISKDSLFKVYLFRTHLIVSPYNSYIRWNPNKLSQKMKSFLRPEEKTRSGQFGVNQKFIKRNHKLFSTAFGICSNHLPQNKDQLKVNLINFKNRKLFFPIYKKSRTLKQKKDFRFSMMCFLTNGLLTKQILTKSFVSKPLLGNQFNQLSCFFSSGFWLVQKSTMNSNSTNSGFIFLRSFVCRSYQFSRTNGEEQRFFREKPSSLVPRSLRFSLRSSIFINPRKPWRKKISNLFCIKERTPNDSFFLSIVPSSKSKIKPYVPYKIGQPFFFMDSHGLNKKHLTSKSNWNFRLNAIANTNSLNGILLVNFPEKEKMFLVKTLAAEHKIPLITQSASLLFKDSRRLNDFSTVKDPIQVFFDKVKMAAPCICFLNDLDSIGEQRNVLVEKLTTEDNKNRNKIALNFKRNNELLVSFSRKKTSKKFLGSFFKSRPIYLKNQSSLFSKAYQKTNRFSTNYTQGIKFLSKPLKLGSFTHTQSENEITKKNISNLSVEPRYATSALLKFLEVLDGFYTFSSSKFFGTSLTDQ
nr:hypothetical protein [Trentepohlia sp. YN1242]